MKRRDLIAALGGVAIWPITARAQQTRVPTIGVLVLGVPEPAPFLKALHEGLRDQNYIDGRNIRLERRPRTMATRWAPAARRGNINSSRGKVAIPKGPSAKSNPSRET